MPDEDKKMVDIDTSGPDASIEIEEAKDESVVILKRRNKKQKQQKKKQIKHLKTNEKQS
jgi:hypothetical protein